MTPTKPTLAAVSAGLGLLTVLTACSDDASVERSDAASTSPLAATSAPSSSPDTPAAPKPTDARTDSRADVSPRAVPTITRSGRKAANRVSAAPASFDAVVSYSDGLRLKVTSINSSTPTEAVGPGGFSNRPATAFTVRLANGSTTPIDLSGVVVTATYGVSANVADPVYDQRSRDFGGTVQPGGKVTATYSFAIPSGQHDDVSLHLDLDSSHSPARLSGKAKS